MYQKGTVVWCYLAGYSTCVWYNGQCKLFRGGLMDCGDEHPVIWAQQLTLASVLHQDVGKVYHAQPWASRPAPTDHSCS